jgi:hypothetical protein
MRFLILMLALLGSSCREEKTSFVLNENSKGWYIIAISENPSKTQITNYSFDNNNVAFLSKTKYNLIDRIEIKNQHSQYLDETHFKYMGLMNRGNGDYFVFYYPNGGEDTVGIQFNLSPDVVIHDQLNKKFQHLDSLKYW